MNKNLIIAILIIIIVAVVAAFVFTSGSNNGKINLMSQLNDFNKDNNVKAITF